MGMKTCDIENLTLRLYHDHRTIEKAMRFGSIDFKDIFSFTLLREINNAFREESL